MAPSAVETIVPAVEALKQKLVVPETEPAAAPEKATPEDNNTNNNTSNNNGGGAVGSAPLEEVDGGGLPKLRTDHREPLRLSGVLEQFKYFDNTPVIGREFVDVDLAEWLRAENSDELLRDLAITISRRGVVFFRKQDNITNELQKELVQRLGRLSGKPATSGLHIHPIINSGRERGGQDNEISVISSVQNRKLYKHLAQNATGYNKPQSRRLEWHSDITFEPVPSDYALLRLVELPSTGGDTLWASGYEVYDRLSAPMQKFLEGLVSYCAQPAFNDSAALNGFTVYTEQRGAPENVGEVLEAHHPVVRTNPVTGWKSIFAVGSHVQRLEGLTDAESRTLLDWFVDLVVENHDLQVRHRWRDPNDLAVWDNRSVYHAATPDYCAEHFGEREGSRAVSLGERPYFDPRSSGRREALRREGAPL